MKLPGVLAGSLSIRGFIDQWTLQNRSLKKSPGRGYPEKQRDTSRTCREAKGRDIVRVSPKGCHILTYPLEGPDLSDQASIPPPAILSPSTFSPIHKSHHPHPILH